MSLSKQTFLIANISGIADVKHLKRLSTHIVSMNKNIITYKGQHYKSVESVFVHIKTSLMN